MKSWKQIEDLYEDHLKRTVNTMRRVPGLTHISEFIAERYPNLYNGTENLKKYDRERLQRHYQDWKGKPISSAEENVFRDFYKLNDA